MAKGDDPRAGTDGAKSFSAPRQLDYSDLAVSERVASRPPMSENEHCPLRNESDQELTVFEAAAEERSHLFFESPYAFRRVRDYPQDWPKLSPKQLAQLSWRR
jgi:hypothetical protein